MSKCFAVIDVGTTNLKLVVFNEALELIDQFTHNLKTTHPHPNWAEQDPETFIILAENLLEMAIARHSTISEVGITNQRETVVAWDRLTGQSLYPAILWEDGRTDDTVNSLLADQELVQYIRQTTGLVPSPYFSATKIAWLYDRYRRQAHLSIGTLDAWMIFRLTGEFLTDYTNASRTMLFDIHRLAWDERLLDKFQIARSILPNVLPSYSDFGILSKHHLPIKAVIGDQQASLFAAGELPGTIKVTYGTGIFPMKFIGSEFMVKDNFLTTLAVSKSGKPQYALETKIDNASRRTTPVLNQPKKLDQVVIELAQETAEPLRQLITKDNDKVYVDGGISQNNTLVHTQAKLNQVQIKRLSTYEGTALGVAKLLASHVKK